VSYSVSGEHLRSVLVDDLHDAGRLNPGLAVHLHGDALLPEDGDLHLAALRRRRRSRGHVTPPGLEESRSRSPRRGYLGDAVVLQVDDPGHGHLHAAEHRHHLQLLVVERRSAEVLNTEEEWRMNGVRGGGGF